MKATQAPPHYEHIAREPLSIYLAVSVAVHGLALVGMLGSVWLWGKPKYYKPPEYSVSLVDAPLSLRQSTPAGGGEKPAEKRPEVNKQEPSALAETPTAPSPPVKRPEPAVVDIEAVEAPPKAEPPKPEPDPKMAEPPAPKPKVVAEPPKKPPEAPPPPPKTAPVPKVMTEPPKKPPETAPVPKVVTEPPKKPPEKRPEPKEATQPPPRTPSPSASPTAAEVQQTMAKLREQQAREEKSQSQAKQVQQQAAEQRLAALRERFGTVAGGAAGPGRGGGGVAGPGTAGGGGSGAAPDMQRIRLQLYQERIRLQIIEAWILPMPQEEARKLQATALLTVSREGEVAHLKLLQPSGNLLFDESLLRAIKQAAPLPPLPEDYQGAFLEVEMRFRPHES